MIEGIARPWFQKICFAPLSLMLVSLRVSPNQVTLLALLCGLAVPYALLGGYPIWAVVLLFASGLADVLDGEVARVSGQSTPYGTLLDIVCDRIVECAAIGGLFLFAPEVRGGICLLMLGSVLLCVTSFLVVGILTPNEGAKGFHYSEGLVERAEAFLFFSAMMLWPERFTFLGLAFAGLTFLTTGFRVWEFYKQSR